MQVGEPAAQSAPMQRADATVALQAFCVLLALGEIGHLIQRGGDTLSVRPLVFGAAVWALARPGIRSLVALLAGLAVEFVADLPDPFNHTFVLGITGGAVALAWAAQHGRDWTTDSAEFLGRVAPLLRLVIVGTWLIAWFAKLNRGFLDSAGSCAAWIAGQVPGATVPSGLAGAVVAVALATELAVPVLLLVRSTRTWGVALAWAFHVVAALAGHTAFSGLAWPFYLLFLDPRVVASGVESVGRLVPKAVRQHPWATRREPWLALWLAIVGLDAAIGAADGAWAARLHRYLPLLAFLVVVAATAWAFGDVVRRRRDGHPIAGAAPMRAGVLGAVVLAIILVNAASPYLGAKSLWSLTMYSNLRTEPGHWNHLVVPEDLRILDWQDDLVRIDGADDEELARALGLGWPASPTLVPAMQIAQVGERHPGSAVTVAGEVTRLEDLAGDPRSEPLARLINIRAVPLEPRCQV